MTSLDHRVLMALQLERWSRDKPLRPHAVERELAALRQPVTPPRRKRAFWLSPFWRRREA